MAGIEKKDGTQTSNQNISYYNGIAAEYDAILNKDAANTGIRAKVANTFTALVKAGSILDFGGGTGQDLGWLLQQHYHIDFCEPSKAMRQVAIERSKNEFPGSGISFFDDNKTDFRNWQAAFPFERKVDAILANFAVINCIPDIGLLFEKLALAIKPGGIVVALVLDSSLRMRLRSNLKGTLRSFFSGDPVSIFIEYNGLRQQVYIHSVKAIKKASANRFELKRFERLQGFGFCLIHLVSK
jgi:SAM-dependent methyltransferase